MKTVKSLAEATRLAAQAGGKLEVGGRTINAGAERAQVATTRAAAPIAPPPPDKPDPMVAFERIVAQQAQISAEQSRNLVQVMGDLLAALQRPRDAAVPQPLPIAFDLEHDENRTLTRIVPIYDSGALH